jgi:hypothetical protein
MEGDKWFRVESNKVPGQSQSRLLYLFLLCLSTVVGGKAQLSKKSLLDAYLLAKRSSGVGESDTTYRSGYPACRYIVDNNNRRDEGAD